MSLIQSTGFLKNSEITQPLVYKNSPNSKTKETIKKIVFIALVVLTSPIWITIGAIVIPLVELYHICVHREQSLKVKGEFKLNRIELKHQLYNARMSVFVSSKEKATRSTVQLDKSERLSLNSEMEKLKEFILYLTENPLNSPQLKQTANKKLIKLLKSVIETKEYQQGKNNKPLSDDIQLIQEICYDFYLQKNSLLSVAMSRFSKKILNLADQDSNRKELLQELKIKLNASVFDTNDIAKFVEELTNFSGEAGFDRNTIHGVIDWSVRHPIRAFHSIASSRSWLGIFNPLENGNPIMPLAEIHFEKSGKHSSMHHIMGSTQTVNKDLSPIFQGFLDACHSKDVHFMEVHLQAPHGEEFHRVNATMGLLNVYPNITINTNTVNGKMFQKGKGLLQGNYEPQSFHEAFKKHLLDNKNGIFSDSYSKEKRGGMGYYMSEQTEEKRQNINDALDKTLECMKIDREGAFKTFFDGLNEGRKARVHQFLFQVIKDVGQMVKTGSNKPDTIYMEHCKEDIDRGAMKNLMTTLVLSLLDENQNPEKGAINLSKIMDIISPVLIRAEIVGDRSILKHQLEIAMDLLKSTSRKDLLAITKAHLNTIGCGDVKIKVSFQG